MLALTVWACQSAQPSGVLTEAQNTPDSTGFFFAPTMQQQLPAGQNAVYAVSLPLAWQAARQELAAVGPIITESTALQALDGSPTVAGALDDSDYQREITWKRRTLTVKTKQQVHRRFIPSFMDMPKGISFNGTKVDAFGTNGFQNMEYANRIDIIAYRDDARFLLRLNFPDTAATASQHELYLFKADSLYKNFEAMYRDLQASCVQAQSLPEQQLTDLDVLAIPKIYFDEQRNFPELKEARFMADGDEYELTEAKQQISLSMNQHGLSMKTEAEIVINDGAYPMEDMPEPKNLVFDKPFYLLMKKAGKENPYLVLYIANTDLLGEHPEHKTLMP